MNGNNFHHLTKNQLPRVRNLMNGIFERKSKFTVILKAGRFDNIASAVIISNVSKAVQNTNAVQNTAADDRGIYLVKTSSFKTFGSLIFPP